MKVAVVGLGAIGTQVFWNLSRQPGVEVHGFDSAYPGHSQAGSGGESRLFRSFEVDDLNYVPLIRRADELWNELEQLTGHTLRNVSGALLIGDGDSEQMVRAQESAKNSDVPHEILTREQMASRFPGITTYETDIGLWDSRGGVIAPELTISATARLAQTNGAIIHPYFKVTSIDSDDRGITVHGNGEQHRFDRVVVACGGWTTQLFPFLRDRIVTKRLTSVWFQPRTPGALDGVPAFMRTAPNYCYAIPTPGQTSIKLGLGFNNHFSTGNPDEVPRRIEATQIREEMKHFNWILEDVLPGLNPDPVRVETYIESYSNTMREFVYLHPEDSRIALLTGFSGHGFKVSPSVGEVGAQLILNGESWFDFSVFNDDQPVFEILDHETGATSHNAFHANSAPVAVHS